MTAENLLALTQFFVLAAILGTLTGTRLTAARFGISCIVAGLLTAALWYSGLLQLPD